MSTPSFKANPWFRLYHEFATDHKIQMLSEADQRRYVMLLCLRCSNGDVTLHDAQIAFQLRISLEEWETTKKRFIEAKLIDRNARVINWEKRQYLSDSSTERVRKHRERLKQVCNVSVTASNGQETVAVTPPDTETDTETDSEAETESNNREQVHSSAKRLQVPVQKIIDLYHEVCLPHGRPPVRVISKKRISTIQRVWKSSQHSQTLDWWRSYFEAAMSIPYMSNGFTKQDGSQWGGADFDYLLQEKTIVKVVERSQ